MSGADPIDGAAQVKVSVLPALATARPYGAIGGTTGVPTTTTVSADGAPMPQAFTAKTRRKNAPGGAATAKVVTRPTSATPNSRPPLVAPMMRR